METDYYQSRKSCWWQEGGRCYIEPCQRDERGWSLKMADKKCTGYWNKRAALTTVIPDEKLIIISELNAKTKKP